MRAWIVFICILFINVNASGTEDQAQDPKKIVQAQALSAVHSLGQSLTRSLTTGLSPRVTGDWGATVSEALKRFEPTSDLTKLFYYFFLIGPEFPKSFKFLEIAPERSEQYKAYLSRYALGKLKSMYEESYFDRWEISKNVNSLTQSLKHKLDQSYQRSDWAATMAREIRRFEPSSTLSAIFYYQSIMLGRSLSGDLFNDETIKSFTYRFALGQLRKIMNPLYEVKDNVRPLISRAKINGDTEIQSLDISTRAAGALRNQGIERFSQHKNTSLQELSFEPRVGKVTIEEIKKLFSDAGFPIPETTHEKDCLQALKSHGEEQK